MKSRLGVLTLAVALVFGLGVAWADDDDDGAGGDHHATPAAEHHEAAPAERHDADKAEHHEAAPAEHHEADKADDKDHDGKADHDDDKAEHHDDGEHHEAAAQHDDDDADADDDDDRPTDAFDEDGDGVVEPDELEIKKEFQEAFDDIPDEPDEEALDNRPEDNELAPSMTVEEFRKLVGLAKKVVLQKMEKKIEKSSAKKMRWFSWAIFFVSLSGFLLLGMPLVLRKKYPGQTGTLFKYSALAGLVFFATINLFGGVLFGFRTVQGALSNYTNPSIAIAKGTFDTLDRNAEDYITMGKELFAPTLEAMRNHPDEQPSALILENGQKIIKDAKVFLSIKRMIKKVDFVFGVLPIVLLIVTMILFVMAILPTLREIIQLPAQAARGYGGAGREVVRKALWRVRAELLATLCTIGVLVVMTFLSAVVLGQLVGPILDVLLRYFALSVTYLQFKEGASSGLVFVTLFGVILFLVLNLACLILSMAFFLGKCQKIFQARFNDGTPMIRHLRFWKWGVPSVVLVQLFPLVFALLAGVGLEWINDRVMSGAHDADSVSWGTLMLAGPAFLVVAYIALFWAARGMEAIKFLFGYKVKPKAQRAPASEMAMAVPPQ
jgi:hypothetical protein